MAKTPKYKQAHTDNKQIGMGDYYGSALPAKIGRMRDDYMGVTPSKPPKAKRFSKPMKSLPKQGRTLA